MMLDVPIEAIEEDYRLTDTAASVADRKERVKQVRAVNLGDEWADTDSTLIRRVCNHIDLQYGGIAAYLDSIGFEEAEQAILREALM